MSEPERKRGREALHAPLPHRAITSLRQADAPEHFGESRISMQVVKLRVYFYSNQAFISVVNCLS